MKAKGAALVDCPVGGSVGPARDGKLIGFVGGDAADVARAKPVLDQMCRRVEHVGPVGSGARMKLAINLPLLVYWQALGEALPLIKSLGLDPARAIDILVGHFGRAERAQVARPRARAALHGKEVTPVTFDVDSIRKDLRTMIEEGQALGARRCPSPRCALAVLRRSFEGRARGRRTLRRCPAHFVLRDGAGRSAR